MLSKTIRQQQPWTAVDTTNAVNRTSATESIPVYSELIKRQTGSMARNCRWSQKTLFETAAVEMHETQPVTDSDA